MKLDRVDSGEAKRDAAMNEAGFVLPECAESRLESGRAHPERFQFRLHLPAQLRCGALANRGELFRMRGEFVERGCHLGLDPRLRFLDSLELLNLGARTLERFDRGG